MTEKELMLSEQLYIANDEELARDFAKAKKLTRILNNTTEEQTDYRKTILKELLGKTGENVYFEPPFHIDYGCNTYVGENFIANYDCIILDVAEVHIGDNVMFGPRVSLYTAGHPIDADVRNSQLEYGKKITIGDNVWLGGNTVVTPGVTIGSNVVIGAGSVVTKDIPDNCVAVGVPCKVIRSITDEDKKYWQSQAKQYYKNKEM